MSRWTTADMPDMSGKTVVVTGAASGIGPSCDPDAARRYRGGSAAAANRATVRRFIPNRPAIAL